MMRVVCVCMVCALCVHCDACSLRFVVYSLCITWYHMIKVFASVCTNIETRSFTHFYF